MYTSGKRDGRGYMYPGRSWASQRSTCGQRATRARARLTVIVALWSPLALIITTVTAHPWQISAVIVTTITYVVIPNGSFALLDLLKRERTTGRTFPCGRIPGYRTILIKTRPSLSAIRLHHNNIFRPNP
ncbi:hypothetical protein F5Y01DRAFT_286516 [Xylaria sp. FL0043]|nr:hypothetical protein F5Y01DRAFT_286516 [Xylaria sp. FL0043]